MRTTLPKMLGALMCVMAAWADVSPAKDFDVTKMAGKWYTVGFGSNAEWFVDHKEDMKMATVTIEEVNGNLNMAYANLNADNTCWRMSHLANKADIPGRFIFHSEVWNNDNAICITDVIYTEYALVHTIKTKDGVSEVLTELLCRSPEASETLKQKFIQFSLSSGIGAGNAVILPQNAECPEN